MELISVFDDQFDRTRVDHSASAQLALYAFVADDKELKPEHLDDMPPMCKIIGHRLLVAKVRVSAPLVIYLDVLSGGNPGNGVMLAYAAADFASRFVTPGKHLTYTQFAKAMEYMAPHPDAFHTCWDAQKTDRGLNGLDDLANWPKQRT